MLDKGEALGIRKAASQHKLLEELSRVAQA